MADRQQQLLLMLILILLFSLPLLNAWQQFPLWQTKDTLYSALGGLIPYSDAAGYFGGAYDLISTGELPPWNSRRPLNAAFLAVKLWTANYNFKITLFIQALLVALSALLTTTVLARSIGKVAAAVGLAIVFLFANN